MSTDKYLGFRVAGLCPEPMDDEVIDSVEMLFRRMIGDTFSLGTPDIKSKYAHIYRGDFIRDAQQFWHQWKGIQVEYTLISYCF